MSSISLNIFRMSTDSNNEAKTLKELLDERSINKSKLVKKMGISYQTLDHWENRRRVPSFENAILLAKELQVSLKTLGASMGFDIREIPPDQNDVSRSTQDPADRTGGDPD